MIKCVDIHGIPVDGAVRIPSTNAVIFEKTSSYNNYMRERDQAIRIAQLEEQVKKMMEFISTTLNK